MPPKSFTYFIKVFGCQMNYADAEKIFSTLAKKGWKKAADLSSAHLLVAVSCGVRQGAEDRVINWLEKTRKTNPGAILVLAGCLGHREDLKQRLRNIVDYFLPAGKRLPSSLINPLYPVLAKGESAYGGNPIYLSRAYIPITVGCDNFCSYCVVPYARGRERSLPPENIIKKAKNLVKKGYKELFLLGQNVNSYRGADRKGKVWTFSQILRTLNAVPGNFWIKFISSHPKDINREMMLAVKDCRKVSKNLHLPLQSGSNKILLAMNRKYRRSDYLATVNEIKKNIPDVVLSTDIIVGFPGETARDFRASLSAVREVGFEMLYALKYSPRPETAAFKLKDDVPAWMKKERQQKLDRVWKKIALEKNKRFLGKNTLILIDRIKQKTNRKGSVNFYALGKNFENKDVAALIKRSGKSKHNLAGKWGVARINQVGALGLSGELVEGEKNV